MLSSFLSASSSL